MGGWFVYYLIIYPLGHLPWKLIYFLSGVLSFLLSDVFRYRSQVIHDNISKVLGHLPEWKRKIIIKNFYNNLADITLESVKGFFMSNKELMDRYILVNPEVLDPYFDEEKTVLVAAGHLANWEWATMALPLYLKHKCSGIYTPLTNSFLEKKMSRTRSGNGLVLIPKSESSAYFSSMGKDPEAIFFLIDQSPSNPDRAYTLSFMGTETLVHYGLEKYARKFDAPVFFLSVERISKGKYELVFKNITDHPKEETGGNILIRAYQELEDSIMSKPSDWLWSHRRWKHQKNKRE
ncbi:MAG TPA: lysophospholipid acyltransferase family protein [Saprospiraceae bacterium]|nr:lysophospholipid acyltransferase family protein [Saprospiraceae bacterium]